MRRLPAAIAALSILVLAAAEAAARGISHAEELRMQANWLRHRGPDGLFPATKEYDRLRLRYAIDPPRFDHYHPKLGPALGQDIRLRVGLEHLCAPINGLLPETPYINYLRWRRSLNPPRFDHYHPQIGHLLATDQTLRAAMPPGPVVQPTSASTAPASQVILPPRTIPNLAPGSLTGLPGGNGPTPPSAGSESGSPPSVGNGGTSSLPPSTKAVPEPASLILLGLGSAVAIRLRRRIR
ncbi:MAG TPA: PEP-CTERM sorting domain-containing protein [Isosphaeraceae bacterium]|jgi:hypothetical protein|nr:PEP-CTERM sorting domain-containing protein [Isosphaeraceae bacterium]